MKLLFFAWLEEKYGITYFDWDENYSSSEGQGKEIVEEYEEYLGEGE